jgi:hypothetical protein
MGPVTPSARHPSTPSQPTSLSRLTQIGWPYSSRSTPVSFGVHLLDPLPDSIDGAVGQVLGDAARADVGVVHA